MLTGIITLPWWGYILVALGLTHITIISVTLFLHRCQAHRSVELHPLVSHFFRFWLWLTTGMVTKMWVAIHRKHHAKVETADDPHSPSILGIDTVLWQGAELYRIEGKRQDTLDRYGHGTPEDWIETNLYQAHSASGIGLMLIINLILFGFIGLSIWAIQMLWIPFFAAGVINGIGHWFGYRNFEPADASTNIVPIGILIGGEELHNNHHSFANSAKFSVKPWEYDIGWLYLKILSAFNLAHVKRVPPTPILDKTKPIIDEDTVCAIIANRLHVMACYAKQVLVKVYQEELSKEENVLTSKDLKANRQLLCKPHSALNEANRRNLEKLLSHYPKLKQVHGFYQKLQELWQEKLATPSSLKQKLQEWCDEAKETGISALQEFSVAIPSYTLKQADA